MIRLLLLVLCVLNAGQCAIAAEVRVAVAANFYHTLNKIRVKYEQQQDDRIEIIRGSTGKLYAQIIHGAPFDLFFSADTRRPDKLIEQSKAEASSAKIYAIGQLALWRPDAQSSQQLIEQLRAGDFNRLAIANPKTAPYGEAAIEVLKALELYDQLKHKMVYAENIAQAVQYVQSGAAGLGLVARSYVNHDIYFSIDSYHHQPIKQKVVLLKSARDRDAALKFLRYLDSEEIKQLLTEDGYLY